MGIQLLCCIFRVIIDYLTVLLEDEFCPLIIKDKLYDSLTQNTADILESDIQGN